MACPRAKALNPLEDEPAFADLLEAVREAIPSLEQKGLSRSFGTKQSGGCSSRSRRSSISSSSSSRSGSSRVAVAVGVGVRVGGVVVVRSSSIVV